MMAALSHALVEMLGIPVAPQLSLAELNDAVLRVPWLGRIRSTDAPAFSGCPSSRAASVSGSSAPHAAAVATASEADEPSPRAMGMSERTMIETRSWPSTCRATRAAR